MAPFGLKLGEIEAESTQESFQTGPKAQNGDLSIKKMKNVGKSDY